MKNRLGRAGWAGLILAVGFTLAGCANAVEEESREERSQVSEDSLETEVVSEVPGSAGGEDQREVVTIGTFREDYNLTELVKSFNQESGQYRAEIKVYYGPEERQQPDGYEGAATAMDLDIVSGNSQDILVIDLWEAKNFASMGAIENLFPYFEESRNISSDDIIDAVVQANTFDDALVSINPYFSLATIYGSSEEFDGEGWTLEEMAEYAQGHPDQALFHGETQVSTLYTALWFMKDGFIDEETGKCNFDTEEFREFLKIVKKFDKKGGGSELHEPEAIQSGKALLSKMVLNTFKDIQVQYEIFQGSPALVGYPTADGRLSCEMVTGSVYAISSKSAQKEGAWAFLEYMLLNPRDDSYGFPVLKSCFDQRAEEAVEVTYVTDANGNQKEIVMGVTRTTLPDGWSIEYHTPRQEEVDLIRKLVEITEPKDPDFLPVLDIIHEESAAFFDGAKTGEDTAKIIQNRVQLYLDEKKE